MTSWNGNIFAVSGTLWGEFTGHRWISLTKISDAQIVSLICDWANDWVNKRGAGDLRRHRACYDVTVMRLACRISIIITIISRCPEHMLARALSQFNSLRPRQNGRHFQTTFSNAFSWMKMYQFRLRFHWSLLPRVELTIFQHWFR